MWIIKSKTNEQSRRNINRVIDTENKQEFVTWERRKRKKEIRRKRQEILRGTTFHLQNK